MADELYMVKKKIPELAYAFTPNGIELAVLDVTHPLFNSDTDASELTRILSKVEKTADKTADKFNRLPDFIKRFFARRSFVMAELLRESSTGDYLTGVSTLMLKLGPHLIGRGRKRFFDRQSARGIGGMVLRMRVRDMSKIQAEGLIPLLAQSPERSLCFINIAGGAVSDSLNALFLIQQTNPLLLKNRMIEINDLDIDRFGPAYAERCIAALKAPGNRFHDLNVTFHDVPYDWNNTRKLQELLLVKKGWLQVCVSEGGLFEYAADEVIVRNLHTIYECSVGDVLVAGSLMHDMESVDRGAIAGLKISKTIKPRFLGRDGLNRILRGSGWNLSKVVEGNPRYLVFRLNKK